MEKQFIRADDQVRDSFLLAKQIYDSGYVPDALIVLWRGGTPIGVVIHEYLAYKGVQTYHTAVKVSAYTGIGQRKDPRMEPLTRLFDHLSAHSRVLVIDDIFDSGSTMQKVVETLAPHVREVRIATLYYKERANQSRLVPDYYQRQTDAWIVFPHELMDLTPAEIRAKDRLVADALGI